MSDQIKWVIIYLLTGLTMIIVVTAVDALTPEQVIALKKSGVSEETIQTMLKQEEAALSSNPYDRFGTREIRDETGRTVVIYSTGKHQGSAQNDEERDKVEKAWKIIENMIIKK